VTEHFDEALGTRLTKAIPDVEDLDWRDVRRRARRPHTRRLLIATFAVALAIGASAPAFGLHRIVVGFFEADPAPQRIQLTFDQFGIAAPAHLDPRVIPNSARRVLVERAVGPPAVLYLAPTRTGGFCYQWQEGISGCRTDQEPPGGRLEKGDINTYLLGVGWEPGIGTNGVLFRLAGNLVASDTERLSVEFADGERAEIPVTWVSKPIDAGFFIYEVPERHRVEGRHATALVATNGDGEVLAQKSFRLIAPEDRERLVRLPNGEPASLPANALPAQARLLIDFEGSRGDRISLWRIPRTDGRFCYHYNRGYGCPPRGWEQEETMSSSISGGGPAVLFFARVVRGVAAVELRYEDGTRERHEPVEGFVLHEVRLSHHRIGHRLAEASALSPEGRVLVRQAFDARQPGAYPCEKPVDIGKGVKACP
jgi:hypothetical protein